MAASDCEKQAIEGKLGFLMQLHNSLIDDMAACWQVRGV